MGIHLDWEVESDSGHDEVNEDAAVVAARQRRQVWNKRALIAALVLLLIGAAIAGYRIREVRAAMRETLSATVESEALALRLGDKRKFMALQSAAEDWRAKQREAFDMFQEAGLAINVTGAILDVEMRSSEARVTVEVLVNSEPSEAVWLYEYSPESGWRHVATESEPWSMVEYEGEWFNMSYYPVDKRYADLVEGYLNSWWALAIKETGYREALPELTLVIDPDAGQLGWQGEGYEQLIIPTIYESTTNTPLLDMERLADASANYWTMVVYGEEVPEFARWLKNETETWFEDMFVPQEALEAHVYASLQAAYSEEIIAGFFEIKRENDLLPIPAMQQAMKKYSQVNLQGSELTAYLTEVLRAEAYLEQMTNDNVARWDSTVGQIFMDSFVPGDSIEGFMVTYDSAKPESIQITEITYAGDILWARVRFEPLWNDPSQPLQLTDSYVPFRNIDGVWVHTYLRSSDGGGVSVERGSEVTLIYDAQNREIAAGLLAMLENIHRETARTFGVRGLPITFVLQSAPYTYDQVTSDTIYLSSPYWICCLTPDQSATEFVRMTAANEVINMMYNRRVQSASVAVGFNPMDWAILDIARERSGLPRTDFFWGQSITPFANSNLPLYIADLWLPDQGWYDDQTRFENYARIVAGRALIQVLTERYGENALPLLVGARSNSFTTWEWINNAFGETDAGTYEEIDAAWWARYVQMMEEQFGVGIMNEYGRPIP